MVNSMMYLFISMERRSSMNDMVFILVIQLVRLPIAIW